MATIGKQTGRTGSSHETSTPNQFEGTGDSVTGAGIHKFHSLDDAGRASSLAMVNRYPYDGKGEYTAPNGDHYPSKKYKNVLMSVTIFILVMECAERLCYYGIVGSLKTFLTNFLNYSNSQAVALTNTVSTVVYFTPLIGAYMADSIWGRYRTILYFGFVYVVGVIVISISTYPSLANSGSFLVGLYLLVAIGAGGIKPNVVTFGADQFDLSTEEGTKQQQQFFNFFYWVINIGAFFSYSVLAQMATNGMGAIPENYGFFASFTISAVAWILAIVVFVLGSKRYIKIAPSGSALGTFLKIFYGIATKSAKGLIVFVSMSAIVLGVILSCIASFMSAGPSQDAVTYVTAVLFVFPWIAIVLLNRDPSYVLVGGERTGAFSQLEIREAYTFIRVWSPVFFAVLFWVVYNQMASNMYAIACQCDLIISGTTQLNGALLNLGDTFAIVIFIPIMERLVYPLVERLKGSKFTSLQKMFWGMIFALLAMLSTAVIEIARKNAPILENEEDSKCAPKGVKMSDLSVWWMLIPYMLIGIAEVLISVPLYDLNYVEVPVGVRSTAQALNLFTTSISGGVSSVISLIFASWITENLNDGEMQNMFWFLSGMTGGGALLFVYVVKDFKYIDELDGYMATKEEAQIADRMVMASKIEDKESYTRRSFASGKI